MTSFQQYIYQGRHRKSTTHSGSGRTLIAAIIALWLFIALLWVSHLPF